MDLVRELISSTGKAKVRVYRRGDGFYEYEEIFEAFDEVIGVYWSIRYQSGMFETEISAMSEIASTTAWLREGN